MKQKEWIFLFIAALFIYMGIVSAAGQLEIHAPYGGEYDLKNNVMKYYGTSSQLVEAHWKDSTVWNNEAYGKKQTASKPSPVRILKSVELVAKINQNYLVANKNVFLLYDEKTSLTCNTLEWNRQAGFVKLSGHVVIKYYDWVIKGSRVEGDLGKGFLTIYGPVEAVDPTNIIRGNKMILDRPSNKGIVSGDAVLIREKNEMTAPEITYFFDTRQVLANGTVKTRIINETK